MSSEQDAKNLLVFLDRFTKVSGLKVNREKSEGLWLGITKNCNRKPIGIRWPKLLKILGLYIGYDTQEMEEKNFREKLVNTQVKINMWKQRQLTIFGKILILKTFGLSQLLYTASLLSTPQWVLEEFERMAFNFLWNGKQHKVKKRVVVQNYSLGGCKMINIKEFLKTQKLKWIKRYLFNTEESAWKYTMASVLEIEDLSLFLKGSALEVANKESVPQFYKELLEIWKQIRFYNINSPNEVLDETIWYNKNLTIENKPIYDKAMADSGIQKISDVCKRDGKFKTFLEIKTEHNVQDSSFMTYAAIINSIPKQWKRMVKEMDVDDMNRTSDFFVYINGAKYDFEKTEIKQIYSYLIQADLDVSAANKK